ncbi:MAG: hypothetical protein EPO61_11205 [Nitrospirae bacterium]|nr:MAG: hypothetical protein EPO61_11205 [Nitrospirota bacterium]
MMYFWRFKGCLLCGCELESRTGFCLMCGQPLNRRRSWLRVLAESLEAQIEGPGGPAVPRDRTVVSDQQLPDQP